MHIYQLMQQDPKRLSDDDLLRVITHLSEGTAKGVVFNPSYLISVIARAGKSIPNQKPAGVTESVAADTGAKATKKATKKDTG